MFHSSGACCWAFAQGAEGALAALRFVRWDGSFIQRFCARLSKSAATYLNDLLGRLGEGDRNVRQILCELASVYCQLVSRRRGGEGKPGSVDGDDTRANGDIDVLWDVQTLGRHNVLHGGGGGMFGGEVVGENRVLEEVQDLEQRTSKLLAKMCEIVSAKTRATF